MRARASASPDASLDRVELLVDGRSVAVVTEPPFESVIPEVGEGRHVATAMVHDREGNVATSAPVTFFVGRRALERYVAQSGDDVEELPNGFVYPVSSDLELIEDPNRGHQVVGLRFVDIRVPRGTEIVEAYLQFTVDEPSAERTELTVQAELSGDAAPFTDARENVSSRVRTAASVKWSPEPWDVAGESSVKQRTPDLSPLLREVIARQDWREGNAVMFIIHGSGRRVAVSYEGAREHAPRLYVGRP